MDEIQVKPTSWSVVKSQRYAAQPAIQLFGYTSKNQSVYVRIPFISTSIASYSESLEPELLEEAKDGTVSDDVRFSLVGDNVIIMTNPSDLSDQTIYDEESDYTDPFGELATFFEQRKISTYQWLSISHITPAKTQTNAELNYSTFNNFVKGIEPIGVPKQKVFFWDIETYTESDEFTNADRDPVTLISVVIADGLNKPKGYVLTRLPMEKLDKVSIDTEVINLKSEKQLLERFFKLWSDTDPDRTVTYNGDSYDIPYMIHRSIKLGVKFGQLGKIKGMDTRTKTETILTGGGPEQKKRFITPGVENVDLLMYFRLRYPSFPNHKLDTVGHRLLGGGKTGLGIDEMFGIFKRRDPEEMKIAGYYSIIDSILLHDLYYGYGETNNIINGSVEYDIEWLCNRMAVTVEDLLHKKSKELINMLGYSIDPGTITIDPGVVMEDGSHMKNNGDFTIKPRMGVYMNVYIYDYSAILYQTMKQSEYEITHTAASLMNGSGIVLGRALWDANFTITDVKDIREYIDQINVDGIIVDLNKYNLVTVRPIEHELLKLESTCKLYAILAPTSRYIVDDDNKITCHGKSDVCKPSTTMEEELIAGWIEHILARNPNFQFTPVDQNTPVDMLVKKIKIQASDEYSGNEAKMILYQQVKPITTFKNVKYVYTQSGVEVYKNQTTDQLDLVVYNRILQSLYDKLIKIQGPNLRKVYYG